jgi:hypothetical protein
MAKHLPFTCTSDEGAFTGHFWLVTNAKLDNQPVYHHACKRCGAVKDVPVFSPRGSGSWKLGTNSTVPGIKTEESTV